MSVSIYLLLVSLLIVYMCIHTSGAFYFTIGNCSPRLRSKLRSIQLLALVKSSHIKMYGINAVLKPIVEDLQKLV